MMIDVLLSVLVMVMHVSDPDSSLNFPAAHCEQGPPLGPVDPELQVQVVTDVLPGGEFE